MAKLDPFSPSSHNKILWCIDGPDCFPSMLCCKLQVNRDQGIEYVVIWGYSVYNRSPGFRTMGQCVNAEWLKKHDNPAFFDDQDEALQYLKELTTPKCDVNNKNIKKPKMVKIPTVSNSSVSNSYHGDLMTTKTAREIVRTLTKGIILTELDKTVRDIVLNIVANGLDPIRSHSSTHWNEDTYKIGRSEYVVGYGNECNPIKFVNRIDYES